MDLIEFDVEGTSPLLAHNPAGSMVAGGGEGAVTRKQIPTPDEEAEHGVYWVQPGVLGIPSPAFRSCLMAAAKNRRIGKTAATSVVKGAVFVVDELTVLKSPGGGAPIDKWDVDVRRVVVQRSAVLRGRPRFEEWAARVAFEYDAEFISASHIEELLTIGGRTVGVGDYRPERTGPFGRFKVLP